MSEYIANPSSLMHEAIVEHYKKTVNELDVLLENRKILKENYYSAQKELNCYFKQAITKGGGEGYDGMMLNSTLLLSKYQI